MKIKNVYYSLKNVISGIGGVISSLVLIIISLIVYRNSGVKYKKTPRRECKILGNGPSLKAVLENEISSFEDSDVFVVNGFATGEYFNVIKPKHYVIVDSNAFIEPFSDYFVQFQGDIIKAFTAMDWDMCFYAPVQQKKSYFIKKIESLGNSHIKIVYINTIPVEGPKWFRNAVCKTGWAMPKTWNILNAVICLALNQGYKKIAIYGADHSWIKDIFINEKNQLCNWNSHFHGKDDYFVMEKGSLEEGLLSFAMCLKSYRYLNEYAGSIGATIVNRTKGSYLDVFDFEI